MRYRLRSYSILFICVTCALFSIAQNPKVDSFKILLKTDKADTQKVNHLNWLAKELSNDDPDTAILLSGQAMQLSETLNWKKGIGSSCIWLAWCKALKGDYLKALDHDFKALRIGEELKDKKLISSALGGIGSIYWNQGDHAKALDYYFRALKLAEELSNKNGIAKHLGNIGLLYYYQANFAKALEYDLKALKMAEELGNKQLQANTLGNIGLLYSDQATSSTDPAGKKALQQKALDYYFNAMKISTQLGNKNYAAIALANIGTLYIETQNYPAAEKYLLQALEMDKEMGVKDGERQDEELISQLYTKTKRFELALQHYQRAMTLKDTLFNEEKDKEITRKEMNYEFEKKEAAARAEQEKQQAVAVAESRRQRLFLWLVVAIGGAVAVIAVIIFRALRITRRQKSFIEQQKKVVEEHQKEILDSIYYARRIQRSLLPTEKYILKHLKKIE